MKPKLLLLLLSTFSIAHVFAQAEDEKLAATILHQDSLFWITYNTCDTVANKKFFTADVEFYHDKGGVTLGAEALSGSMKKNLCSTPGYHLRREAVAGTVKVFPLKRGNEIYGAILSGEHLFYITESGKPEYLDGQARFTHLWLLNEGQWKMARILSYDHHQPEYINKHRQIELSQAALRQWAGKYQGAKSGTISIEAKSETLQLVLKNGTMQLYPETRNLFFSKERDLTFEFVENSRHQVLKMLVREAGALAEEATFISKK
jgi:hypothetical protein